MKYKAPAFPFPSPSIKKEKKKQQHYPYGRVNSHHDAFLEMWILKRDENEKTVKCLLSSLKDV